MKISLNAQFITLTYAEEHIKLSDQFKATLEKRDLQLFFKRLRKKQYDTIKKSSSSAESFKSELRKWKIKYYAVGEYGGKTDRPHYHIILFNLLPCLVEILPRLWYDNKTDSSMGHIDVGTVTDASIHYVTGYVMSLDKLYPDKMKPFSLMSKNLGINYIEQNKRWHRKNDADYVIYNGVKMAMPRYYREKAFSKIKREQLNVENLKIIDENSLSQMATDESNNKCHFEESEKRLQERVRGIRKRIKNNKKL